MANDHYVTQALMRNWSGRNHQGDLDGFVWCFDFTTNTLKRFHTKQLFAAEGLNSEAVEKRLGQVLENQLAPFIKFASAEHTPEAFQPGGRTIYLGDENRLRAISIAFAIQAARGVDGTSGKAAVETAKILTQSDEGLHRLGASWREHHSIATLTLKKDEPLCLPETGCFWFPIVEPDPHVGALWSLAIPLNPWMALVSTPRGVDVDVERHSAFLSYFSIADATVKRVVLPMPYVPNSKDHSAIKQALLARREWVMKTGLSIELVRVASAERRATAGLPPLLNPLTWKFFLSR